MRVKIILIGILLGVSVTAGCGDHAPVEGDSSEPVAVPSAESDPPDPFETAPPPRDPIVGNWETSAYVPRRPTQDDSSVDQIETWTLVINADGTLNETNDVNSVQCMGTWAWESGPASPDNGRGAEYAFSQWLCEGDKEDDSLTKHGHLLGNDSLFVTDDEDPVHTEVQFHRPGRALPTARDSGNPGVIP